MRTSHAQRVGAVVAVLAIFAIIAGAAGVAQNSGSSSASTPTTAASTTSTTGPATTTTVLDPSTLTGAARELYDLIQAGRASRYHVVFALSGSALATDTTAASLEVWRDGPHIRQDTRFQDNRGDTYGANIGGPDGTIVCQQQKDIPLTCQQQTTTPLDPNADLLTTITDRLGTPGIQARDGAVSGIAARCFLLAPNDPKSTAEVCLTAAGAPVSINAGGLRAVVTTLDDAVDASSFTPPAPVSGSTPTVVDSTIVQSSVVSSTVITPSTAP